jgi:hypothetical protein
MPFAAIPDHLKTFNPGETLPSGDKAGKGPGAASLSEYIETTLTKSEVISQGRLGFDPAFESKGGELWRRHRGLWGRV